MPAAYGYWIHPDGTILEVNTKHGHLDVIQEQPEVFDLIAPAAFADLLNPSRCIEGHEWYDAALGSGWVRIIACERRFHYQFKYLTTEARRSLLELISTFIPCDRYVFESSNYKIFDQGEAAVFHINSFQGEIHSLSDTTWTNSN